MLCVADFEAHAREVLDKFEWSYFSTGAMHQQTLTDNVEAFKRYRILPRVLRDVSNLDTRVSLFGEEVAFPIGVSPTAMHRLAHPDGEVATARACAKMGVCMTLSTISSISIEEVAGASGGGLRWFNVYLMKDRELTKDMVLRAEKAGYKALVVTVDMPAFGRNLTYTKTSSTVDIENLKRKYVGLSAANFVNTTASSSAQVNFDPAQSERFQELLCTPNTWNTIDWLRSVTKLPILLKGILTAEDALEAVKHDIQGILVSNHGGRQLDGVPATIDALPEVVEAVRGRVEVFLDGGVREGTDVLKALALGARAVFVGRPVLWGLAYKGSPGVEQVLQILRDEFRLAMMLSGCAKLSDIKPELVVHESYYTRVPRSK